MLNSRRGGGKAGREGSVEKRKPTSGGKEQRKKEGKKRGRKKRGGKRKKMKKRKKKGRKKEGERGKKKIPAVHAAKPKFNL